MGKFDTLNRPALAWRYVIAWDQYLRALVMQNWNRADYWCSELRRLQAVVD